MKKRPNLILFNPETTRADAVLGAPAGRAHTPVLNSLAAQGCSFTNAFCQSPFCAPSRISMFTGQYPHTQGHRSLLHLLHSHERNLFLDLKEAGYKNVVFGKNDLMAQDAKHLAFDEYQPRFQASHSPLKTPPVEGTKWHGTFYNGEREAPALDSDWSCIESALQFLAEPHDKPFCLFLLLNFAHPPYVAEKPYFSLHDRSAVKRPLPVPGGKRRTYGDAMRNVRHADRLNEADFREIRAVYYGMINRVDTQLGQLLAALKEHNLEENTVVAYFSDHGDYAGDYGMVEKFNSAFEDALIHVPLVMRVPGMPEGKTIDQLVEMTDLYATLMELTDLQPQHDHFSQSLVPLLRGEDMPARVAVFSEAGFNFHETQSVPLIPPGSIYAASRQAFDTPEIRSRVMMIRDESYKYIYNPGDCDELFDLQNDPGELHNLAQDPAQKETITSLREKLLRWMLDSSDVLPQSQDSRHWLE